MSTIRLVPAGQGRLASSSDWRVGVVLVPHVLESGMDHSQHVTYLQPRTMSRRTCCHCTCISQLQHHAEQGNGWTGTHVVLVITTRHLIYECPESFLDSLTMPMDTFPQLFWCAFVLIDSVNVHRKFEMRSHSRSWDNSDWSFGWGLWTLI